jgi:lauroyl/myristoyl acyltransferase
LAAPPYSRDSTDIIERYAREVEAQIIASPTDFLWLHRKWKYKKPAYR